ncbi:MAG: YcaO-like family protein [Acetobacteraceae bacterium]|nr:YcaO-like family protein [Acetobacteraceae bacterium]
MISGVAAPDDGPKRFRDGGTHRTDTPEAALSHVLPLAQRLGITRVGNLTGLDRIGVPVFAAYRPNSRSLAVFQGKGASLAAAKASAVMEAAEAWHAEHVELPRRKGRRADLSAAGLPAVDPAHLARAADAPLGDPRGFAFDWVQGHDLFTGEPRWVPLDVVTADFTLAGAPRGPFQATANGLASGRHPLEAIAHALAEVIERDALALWYALPDATQDATALDLGTVPAALRTGLLDRFSAAGVALRAFDATSDIGVATVLCLAVEERGGAEEGEVLAELGSGCHPDPAIALARAAAEAAQGRLQRIAGARDDLPGGRWSDRLRTERAAAARAWLEASAAPRRVFGSLPDLAGDTLAADIAAMLARLAGAGLVEAVWVDLARPNIGLSVVRVVVPGLEGQPGLIGGGYVQGLRARRAMNEARCRW